MNTLYYGDNLKILRDYIKDESVDLEAVGNRFYPSPGWNKDFPKLQILTIEDLFNGKQVQLPPSLQTFKQAEKISGQRPRAREFNFRNLGLPWIIRI